MAGRIWWWFQCLFFDLTLLFQVLYMLHLAVSDPKWFRLTLEYNGFLPFWALGSFGWFGYLEGIWEPTLFLMSVLIKHEHNTCHISGMCVLLVLLSAFLPYQPALRFQGWFATLKTSWCLEKQRYSSDCFSLNRCSHVYPHEMGHVGTALKRSSTPT